MFGAEYWFRGLVLLGAIAPSETLVCGAYGTYVLARIVRLEILLGAIALLTYFLTLF